VTHDADVAVIGAGIAGLTCADRLLAAGRRVVVVEARPRVGGRMDTRRPPGWPGPVELGAEFVHGRPPELLAALRRAGAERVTIPDRHFTATGGRLHSAAHAWKAAQAVLERLADGAADASFTVAARRGRAARGTDRETRNLARGFVEGFNAADADRASARWLKHLQESADESSGLFRVRAGYDQLTQLLAQRIARRGGGLLLGAVVNDIDWRSDGVRVRARGLLGDDLPVIAARAAVVTLPLGILQASAETAVRFTPGLPAGKRRAIRALAMGSVVKVVLRFRPAKTRRAAMPPWPNPPTFIHAPDAAIPTWWRPLPLPPHVIVGWAAGPAADALGRAHRSGSDGGARTLRVAVDALARALELPPRALRSALEEGIIVDWRRDPFARGAYAWVPAGASDASATLAQPVDGRLFFAGEATATDSADIGTVHGAMETGARAANQVLAALGRPPLRRGR
jgi:monoamine oxidase